MAKAESRKDYTGSVAVIGGGLTGLSAAYKLNQVGFDVSVFEASAAAGGQISSARQDGYLLEAGPHTLLERGYLPDLIAELGLQDRVTEANAEAKKRFVVRDGAPHALPTSLVDFLSTPILSPAAKLRLLAEPFIPQGPSPAQAAKNAESLAEFITRRLGPEVLEFAVDPMVAGTYAGDATKLSVRHVFPKLYELEQAHGSLVRGGLALAAKRLRGVLKPGRGLDQAEPKKSTRLINFDQGSQVLIDELVASLQDAPMLQSKVIALEKKDNGRWLIRFEETNTNGESKKRQKTVDAVFCALPAGALADISLQGDAPFEPLRAIPYAPVSVVSMGFRHEDIKHPLDGFGMLIPREERRDILGTLFMSTLFPNRAPQGHVLLTSFVGGARSPELANLPDKDLFRRTLADLDALLGVRGAPTMSVRRYWGDAIPQYNLGHGAFETRIGELEDAHPGLFIGGSFRDGIAVPDRVGAGYAIVDPIKTYLSSLR